MQKYLPLIAAFFLVGNLYAEPIKTPQHVFGSINSSVENNPGDYPLPTEMTFRKFADHSIDCVTQYFDPSVVQKGDTIYVSDWYLGWFIRYVHPMIKYPYILISNDSDSSHPDTGIWDYDEKNGWPLPIEAVRTLLYDSKVAAWFCKNMLLSRHPKITQIPIGPNIIYWTGHDRNHFQGKDCLLAYAAQENKSKEQLLLLNMNMHTNPIRPVLFDMFKEKSFCLCVGSLYINNFSESRCAFYQKLATSTFVLAPPGYGPDTVRFWEAVLLNSIPIVKHFELDDLYADMPVLFVHEWDEINEDFLKKKYEEIQSKKFSNEKAYFDYWLNRIKIAQNAVRNGTNDFSYLQATSFPEHELENLSKILKLHKRSSSDFVLCKGAAMTLRPFQLAQKCSFIGLFYVQDSWGAWGHENATSHLKPYGDFSLLKGASRISTISYYDDAYAATKNCMHKRHVFLDLTYLRSKLPGDLETAYQNAGNGTLICGNCAEDSFVQEVLQRFENKHCVSISKQETIWFLVK